MGSYTTPDHFFDGLIDCLCRDLKLQLMGCAQVSTDNAPYHVPVTWARERRMFFRLPGKQLIIQVNWSEVHRDEHPGRTTHMSFTLHVGFASWNIIYQHLPRLETPVDDPYKDPWDQREHELVPLMQTHQTPEGFRHLNNFRFEAINAGEISPYRLREAIGGLIRPAMPYIAKGNFEKVQVTNWAPHYTFGEKGVAHFWKRLGIGCLFQAIEHPWGSDPVDEVRKRRERAAYRDKRAKELAANLQVGDLIIRPLRSFTLRNEMIPEGQLGLDIGEISAGRQHRQGFILCRAIGPYGQLPFMGVPYQIGGTSSRGTTCVYVPESQWIPAIELREMAGPNAGLIGLIVTEIRHTSVEARPLYVPDADAALQRAARTGVLQFEDENGTQQFIVDREKARSAGILDEEACA